MIWNIKKANARISELETELTETKEKLSGLEANQSDATQAAESATAELESLRAELATAKQTIGTLQGKVTEAESKISALTQERDAANVKAKDLQATIDNPAGEIEKRASAKALEITAAQGQPPIKATASPDPTSTKSQTSEELKGRARVVAAFRKELNPTN